MAEKASAGKKAAPKKPKARKAPVTEPGAEAAVKAMQPPVPQPGARAAAKSPVPASVAPALTPAPPALIPAPVAPNPNGGPPQTMPPEKDEFVEYLSGPASSWWDFTRANYKGFYLRMLKLNFARFFAMAAAAASIFIIFLAVFAGGAFLKAETLPIAAAALILAILSLVFLMWANQLFENASYLATEAQINKKPFSMISALFSLKGISMRFTLVDSLIRLALLVPALLVLGAVLYPIATNSPERGVLLISLWLAYIILLVYMYLTNLLADFILQFWRYFFLFEGRGVIASLRPAASIIRRNPAEVLMFDILILISMLVFSVPYAVFFGFTYLILVILQFFAIFIPILGILVYLLAVVIIALAGIFFTTIIDLSWRPAQYFVWRKLIGK